MKREVWAQFGDGSVANYGVADEDLPGLLAQFRDHGVSCTLWIDGQLWKPGDPTEGSDYHDGIVSSPQNDRPI